MYKIKMIIRGLFFLTITVGAYLLDISRPDESTGLSTDFGFNPSVFRTLVYLLIILTVARIGVFFTEIWQGHRKNREQTQ